jgi:hypothetical protein
VIPDTDTAFRNEIITGKVCRYLLVSGNDFFCSLESNAEAMMSEMPSEPSITMIPIAEETQISNLYTPFRDLIILYSIHLIHVILQI